MVIATSNITFSSIQTEFGGTNPIDISEYYKNAATYYTSNITSLPLINSTISISSFANLAKDINILYTTAGTYTYTVPVGINTLCVLCVGGGGAGAYNTTSAAGGGGGGGLVWVNNISVTTGQSFTIIVGAGGNGASGANTAGIAGNASRFYSGTGTTFNIQANGGAGAATRTGGTYAITNTAGIVIGTTGGGNGGAGGAPTTTTSGGGGGAAGYTGNGGNGATGSNGTGGAGLGGGGGGGNSTTTNSGGAGGVGILNGQGTNGTAGAPSVAAGGGSGGETGPLTPIYSGSIAGGAYGGGGAGNRNTSYPSLNRSGGRGAVRIMALGINSNRSFPTNALAF
jgi:hypothetical protein